MVPEAALVLVALRGEEARVRTSRIGQVRVDMAWRGTLQCSSNWWLEARFRAQTAQ